MAQFRASEKVPETIVGLNVVLERHRKECSAQAYEAIAESWNELLPWQPWVKKTKGVESCEAYSDWLAPQWGSRFDYQIFHRETKRFLGQANLEDYRPDVPSVMVGYWLRTSETGKGYATEAASLLREVAFDVLQVVRFELLCDEANCRSVAVAYRLGMQLEGVLRNESRNTLGELQNTMVFSQIKP